MINESYSQELKKIRGLLVGLNKGLTVTEISRKIGINRNSVSKYLDILLTSGIVEMKVVGSAKLFTISKRMPFTSIINVSSDYILVLDDDSRVSYANENMLSFEKKTLDQITGMQSGDLEVTRLADPDIRKFIEESLQGKEFGTEFEISGGPTPFFFKAKFVPGMLENSKKGVIIILNNIANINQPAKTRNSDIITIPAAASPDFNPPLDGDGATAINYEKASLLEKNITNYQKYLELATQGIWAIDETFRTSFANAWMAGMLGYSVNEMIGKSVYDFVSPIKKEHVEKYLQNLRDNKDVPDNFEFEFIRKDGIRIFTLVGLSPFISETGKFIGALATISDITDRKRAEDALRNSEKYYRTIIETSPNGILIFDNSGLLKMTNMQTAKYLGYVDPKDLEGKNIFDFISPNDLEKCENFFNKAIENQDSSTLTCTLIKKDGTGFCADLTVSLFNISLETENFFIGIITDISEHRKAVNQIKKSELKYRSLVEEIGSVIFTTDIRGKITYISPVIQKVLGYSPDELLGKHFYALVDSFSRHSLGVKLKEAQTVKLQPSDFQMIDKSGNSRWVRIITQPLVHEGRLQGISGIIEDINDWKKTENALLQCEIKYKIVVEDQIDLICRFSPDYGILFINPAFWKFFNKTENEILGTSFLDFIPSDFHQILMTSIEKMDTKNFVKTIELNLVTPKGNTYSFHATIRAVLNAEGKSAEYQIICRDITDLKAYFERSQSLLKEIQTREIKLNAQNEELRKLQRYTEISEMRYRDLYDKVPAGILTLDMEGRIISLNLTATQFIGRPRKYLIGQVFSNFISHKDLETFSDFLTSLFRMHKKQTCEICLNGSGDLPLMIKIDGYVTDDIIGGSPQCQMVFTDISEFNLLENRIKNNKISFDAKTDQFEELEIPR